MAELNFDATEVPPAEEITALPPGAYIAIGENSEWKTSKAGSRYLQFTWQIVEGMHTGRRAWSIHNLEHPNPKVVQIARRELSSICHAVNVMKPSDTNELLNIPLCLNLDIEEFNGKQKNRVKSWKKLDDHVAKSFAEKKATGGPLPWEPSNTDDDELPF